jgi:hypothetical protein
MDSDGFTIVKPRKGKSRCAFVKPSHPAAVTVAEESNVDVDKFVR